MRGQTGSEKPKRNRDILKGLIYPLVSCLRAAISVLETGDTQLQDITTLAEQAHKLATMMKWN